MYSTSTVEWKRIQVPSQTLNQSRPALERAHQVLVRNVWKLVETRSRSPASQAGSSDRYSSEETVESKNSDLPAISSPALLLPTAYSSTDSTLSKYWL